MTVKQLNVLFGAVSAMFELEIILSFVIENSGYSVTAVDTRVTYGYKLTSHNQAQVKRKPL